MSNEIESRILCELARRELADVKGTRDQAIVKVLLHIIKELLPFCLEKNMNGQQVRDFFQEVFEHEVVRAWTVLQVIVLTEFEEEA